MDVRPEIQIQSMIKAMIDVVLPAVDEENKLAQEQARLIIGTLQLVAKRLPIAYRYDVDELRRYVGLAQDMMAAVGDGVDTALVADLKALTARSADVLEGARSEPSDVENAAFELRAVVGRLVQEASQPGIDSGIRKSVRRLVLQASKVELDREVAVVAEMGFCNPLEAPRPPIDQQLPPLRQSC